MSSRPLKFAIKDNLYGDVGIDLKGKDYRKITVDEINKSYKKMLTTQHPDKVGATAKANGLNEAQINEAVAAANEKMALANKARDILTDTNKRSQFDLHFSNYHHLTDTERAAKHATAEKMNQENIKKKGQEWAENPNNRKSSAYRSSYSQNGSGYGSGSGSQAGSNGSNGSSNQRQSSGNHSGGSRNNGSNANRNSHSGNGSQHSSSNNSWEEEFKKWEKEWEEEFKKRYGSGQSEGSSSTQGSHANGNTAGNSESWSSSSKQYNTSDTHSSRPHSNTSNSHASGGSGGGGSGGGTTYRSSYSSYKSKPNKKAAFGAEKWIKDHPSETTAIGIAVIAAGGWALYELAKRLDEKNKEASPLPPR